jgi:hypothetical protein
MSVLALASAYATHEFGIEMPVLRDLLRNSFLQQEPDRPSSAEEAPSGHRYNPNIEEAGCEVVSYGTYWSPAFTVTA